MNELNTIKLIWGVLDKKNKRSILYLLCLMAITSLFDAVSVSLVFPFLSFLVDPEIILIKYNLFGLSKYESVSYDRFTLLIYSTFIFVFALIITGCLRIFLLFLQNRICYDLTSLFSVKIFRNSLYVSYEKYINNHSSIVINGITNRANLIVNNLIYPTLIILNSLALLITILIALLLISPALIIITFLTFSIIYFSINLITKSKIKKYGIDSSRLSLDVIKYIQEAYGNLKDIILNSDHERYINNFNMSIFKLQKANAYISILGSLPKYFLETLSISLVAIIACIAVLFNVNNTITVIPTFGLLALSIQRLLPAMQGIFNSWISICGGLPGVLDAYKLIKDFNSNYLFSDNRISLTDSVKLKSIYFQFEGESNFVLNNINLEMTKGDFIGIYGKSGNGKSTLLNIIMTLLAPSSGCIYVDNIKIDSLEKINSWRKSIGHVSQDIYLIDSSIKNNIALNIDETQIDFELVKKVSQIAELHDEILTLPGNYNYFVGERGSKISGGQKQRIGIARALYKNPSIIVLDEATSALDSITEEKIYTNLTNKGYTTILVTHHENNLRFCNHIYKLENGFLSVCKRS